MFIITGIKTFNGMISLAKVDSIDDVLLILNDFIMDNYDFIVDESKDDKIYRAVIMYGGKNISFKKDAIHPDVVEEVIGMLVSYDIDFTIGYNF